MAKKNAGKYYLKNTSNGTYSDVTTLFDGVNILAVNNLDGIGKSVNVYKAQWVNSQTEDFLITTTDNNNNPVVVRENVDIVVVFAVSGRYANAVIDAQTVYDNFVSYMTNSDVWIGSTYVGKQVHCFAFNKFEPKTIKLQRGNNSYILGEITLHTLDKPTTFSAPT